MTKQENERIKSPVRDARQLDAVLSQVREALAGLSLARYLSLCRTA